MKYVIDVDAFKSVLDLLPTYVARDGDNLIEIDDVKKLLQDVSDKVYAHTGIRLEPEVRIW